MRTHYLKCSETVRARTDCRRYPRLDCTFYCGVTRTVGSQGAARHHERDRRLTEAQRVPVRVIDRDGRPFLASGNDVRPPSRAGPSWLVDTRRADAAAASGRPERRRWTAPCDWAPSKNEARRRSDVPHGAASERCGTQGRPRGRGDDHERRRPEEASRLYSHRRF